MKDILIITNYTVFENEGGNSRFNYIADKLSAMEDVNVELITSSFFHSPKRQRVAFDPGTEEYKVTLLYEPGYKKNLSLRRFYSHFVIGENLKRYLMQRKIPDCIYCAMPSLSVAYSAARYAEENGVRFILDIQDLWPEAFRMVFHVPIISQMIFWPIKKRADKIYGMADEIVAVSDTYGKRAFDVNKKSNGWTTCFLGTDLDTFDSYRKEKKEDNVFRIAYIGTLGYSYDIKCVLKAIWYLNKKGMHNIEFLVMGEGPLRGKFESYSKSLCVNAVFTGRLEYPEMVERLCQCDVAVNPISKAAAQSIINKVGDYAAAGLPVINTQECPEYRNLIEQYRCGINCSNGNAYDVARAIYRLYRDKKLRVRQGKNNRKLAEELFDREQTYKKIISLIVC